MLSDVEYRSVIRFLLLRHFEAKRIIEELTAAYGDDIPSKATVYNWIRDFKSGRTDITDRKSTGRPIEIGDQHREKLKSIVRDDRRITKEALAQRINVSYGTVRNLLKELGIRKLCSRFVPYFITAEMSQRRLQCCQYNIELYQELGDIFLNNIVTEDETPLSLYLPDDRRSSAEFKFPGETASKKLRTGTSHRRALMLSVFWDAKGPIHVDIVDKTVTLNAVYYAEQVQITRTKRRKPRGQQLYLLHDNAPIHSAHASQAAIQQAGFTQLAHPPYSPDLAPSDFFLFRHLKQHLRGRHFQCKEQLQAMTEDFLETRSPQFFRQAFDDLVRRWTRCVENGGGYIEK